MDRNRNFYGVFRSLEHEVLGWSGRWKDTIPFQTTNSITRRASHDDRSQYIPGSARRWCHSRKPLFRCIGVDLAGL